MQQIGVVISIYPDLVSGTPCFKNSRMRILFDAQVPHALRHHFRAEDEVFTAQYLGWHELTNGALLEAADEAAFSVLVTFDRGIPRQQAIRRLALAIIVLLTPQNDLGSRAYLSGSTNDNGQSLWKPGSPGRATA